MSKRIKKLFNRRNLRSFLIVFVVYQLLALIIAPDASEFKIKWPEKTAFMRISEEELGKSLSYKPVRLENISPHLRHAVIISEDAEFSSHSGFSVGEIYHSITDAITKLKMPRGASTITQQLAKNLYLSPSKNPFRKLKEAVITSKMESTLSKRRILELYLNVIELGPGIFGAEAAAKYWFNKSASQLNQDQAAFLTAILPGPNDGMNPNKYSKRVNKRKNLILSRMANSRLPPGL